jgi:hypothetical protein
MQFIERFFGIPPDGGSGALELLYFAALLAICRCRTVRCQRR